jgi:hypothetical protein
MEAYRGLKPVKHSRRHHTTRTAANVPKPIKPPVVALSAASQIGVALLGIAIVAVVVVVIANYAGSNHFFSGSSSNNPVVSSSTGQPVLGGGGGGTSAPSLSSTGGGGGLSSSNRGVSSSSSSSSSAYVSSSSSSSSSSVAYFNFTTNWQNNTAYFIVLAADPTLCLQVPLFNGDSFDAYNIVPVNLAPCVLIGENANQQWTFVIVPNSGGLFNLYLVYFSYPYPNLVTQMQAYPSNCDPGQIMYQNPCTSGIGQGCPTDYGSTVFNYIPSQLRFVAPYCGNVFTYNSTANDVALQIAFPVPANSTWLLGQVA